MMLLRIRDNFMNWKSPFMSGVVLSLSSIILTACVSTTKEATKPAVQSVNIEQVKVYNVVPTIKPVQTAELSYGKSDKPSFKSRAFHVGDIQAFAAAEKVYEKVGKASWYGAEFNGRLTANGEIYNMDNLTAAHPSMPLPSYARVTNLENGASIVVRVNDRGPHVNNRIIDLSKQAATMLDYKDNGLADVKIEYVGRAPLEGNDNEYLIASYKPGNITSEELLAIAGVKLDNAKTVPVNSENSVMSVNDATTLDKGKEFPALPEVGPILIERPEPAQWVAYIDGKSSPVNAGNTKHAQELAWAKGVSEAFTMESQQ